MSTEVRDILDRIGRLDHAKLAELRSELDRAEQQEWQALLPESRRLARDRHLDDDAIARAVEQSRYGSRGG